MEINVRLQDDGGLSPRHYTVDPKVMTSENPKNSKRFRLCRLYSHLNVLAISPPVWRMFKRF